MLLLLVDFPEYFLLLPLYAPKLLVLVCEHLESQALDVVGPSLLLDLELVKVGGEVHPLLVVHVLDLSMRA